MKNLNKVLAMLVVFMMVVSTVAFASFTDVAEDSTYNVAIKVGTDLGLFTGYEDGSFKPEGEITRAEFAAIVVRMKGQEAQAEGAKSATMFTDVPADHWAAGYINIAVRLGIINGYGDGNFGPSDLVEYQDAITMMVRALGYDPAIGAAGYPTGYLTKAGDLGLTANVSGVNGVAINRGKVAQIVFNALDVALMTQSGYGTFTQYVVNDGYSSTNGTTNTKKTILSENHSIVKVQGIVLSSSLTTNATNTGTEKVDFDITNALYNKFNLTDGNMEVAESGASAYVGKKVIAFIHYNEFTGVKTIVSLYDAPVADELVVALQDLDTTPNNFAGTFTYTYYNENGRVSSVTAAKYNATTNTNIAPDVYINGVNWSDVTNRGIYDSKADLEKLSGTITFALLDTTNTTADYDTIYVDAAMPFVVDDVKAGNSTVKGKAIGTINRISYLEEDGKNEASLYGADGAAMDWADLEENDVLMVKYVTTANKNLYEATLVENKVEGKVDGLAGNVGAPTREITIGGVAYKVAGDVETNVTAIKANDEGIFYLDANDNIVYFDVTSSVSRNYGYVIDTAAPQAGNFLSGYQMQILTKDNTVVVFDLYKKIKFNANSGLEVVGTAAGDGTVGANEIGYSAISGLVDSVITYNVNSANEITAIFTAGLKSTTDDEDLDSTFTYDDAFAAGTNDLTGFDPDDNTFGKYSIDENTVIFLVEANTTAKDRKKAEVVAVPVLEEDDKFVNATLYNVDADDYINCILIHGTGSVIGGQSESATFVLKVAEGTDEEGNTIYTVTGYKDCEVVTYTVDDANILKGGTTNINFYVGKLVVPVFEVNGDVKSFKHTGNVTTPVGGALAEKRFATVNLGTNGKIDGNKLLTFVSQSDVDGDGTIEENEVVYAAPIKIKSDANVYVYDSRKAASGRGFYQIDADGYLDWDFNDGIYYGTNSGEKNLNVTATIFYTDTTDAVDVLFYIN